MEEDEFHAPREDLADVVADLLQAGEPVLSGGQIPGADGAAQREKRDRGGGGGAVGGAGEEGEGLVEVVGGGLVVAGDVEVDEFVILLGEAHGVEGGVGFGGEALGEFLEAALVALEHRAQNILRVDAHLFVTVLEPFPEERKGELRVEVAEGEDGVAAELGAGALEDFDDGPAGGGGGQRVGEGGLRFVVPHEVAARAAVDGRQAEGEHEGQRSEGAEDREEDGGRGGEPPERT